MKKQKRPVGRPKSNDPKIKPPSIVLTQSSIEKMNEIAEMNCESSLSSIYQKAIDIFILVIEK